MIRSLAIGERYILCRILICFEEYVNMVVAIDRFPNSFGGYLNHSMVYKPSVTAAGA